MIKIILGICLLISSSAFAVDLNTMNKDWEPAAIEIVAPSATVVIANGKSTITLHDIDKLAGIISALHKNSRSFDAFPVAELTEAWNSCNAMKEDMMLWHEDGLNSLVIFHSGVDADPKNTHGAKAPLVTAPKDTTRTLGGDEGIAKLMLVDATLVNNDLSFDIKGGVLATGDYTRVRVITECFAM
ncbi:MAG: hypothetical protein V7711_18670 [Pseudomonadales bacterium]